MAVLPIADTVKGFTGSIFEEFLAPHFRDAYRPVRQGDIFRVWGSTFMRHVEFKILEVEPRERGIVGGDTVIHSGGKPLPRSQPIRILSDTRIFVGTVVKWASCAR